MHAALSKQRRTFATAAAALQALRAPNARVAALPQSNVFAACTKMALETGAVNLGQGFPSWPVPDFVLDAARSAIHDAGGFNQYSRPGGHPLLLDAISRFSTKRMHRQIAHENVTVTAGAQGAIHNIFATFMSDGDEAVCIEPAFEMYGRIGRLFNCRMRGVPLGNLASPSTARTSEDLTLDMVALEAAITDRTRLLILNTPHNPTGKVFSRAEYEAIAALVRRHPRLLVLSDDVYEFMLLEPGLEHVHFASLPDMWARTISAFSAGKTFSCTGWRIGYCIGPPELIAPLITTQSIVSFCAAAPLEVAMARAFDQAEAIGYFETLAASLRAKRDVLCESLRSFGLRPIVPGGGYFVMTDTSAVAGAGGPSAAAALADDNDFTRRRDYQACTALTKSVGVLGLPIGGFYSPPHRHESDSLLRFAFCKAEDELTEACRRFAAAKEGGGVAGAV
jgi:aspartate/methionine/tyrosine aminotransferase